jgi:hypothetical protein
VQTAMELDVIEETSATVHAALEVANGLRHRKCRRGVQYVPRRCGNKRRNRVPHMLPKPDHVIIHSERITQSLFDNSKCHGKRLLRHECQGRVVDGSLEREPPSVPPPRLPDELIQGNAKRCRVRLDDLVDQVRKSVKSMACGVQSRVPYRVTETDSGHCATQLRRNVARCRDGELARSASMSGVRFCRFLWGSDAGLVSTIVLMKGLVGFVLRAM